MHEGMTTHAMVLVAASDCDPYFTPESLAVAAWRRWPEHFGLSGYNAHHPDNNRVAVNLYGRKGLVARGWLKNHGKGRFTITPVGLAVLGPRKKAAAV